MPSPEPPLLPGLELLRPIGRGSFGEVWLARTVTGQYRAVKLVPLGAEGSGLQALGERVFRGVQAYLDHLPPGSPAALAVLHVDRDPAGRFLYYVMELADDVAGGRAFAPEHYQALTLSELRRRAPGQYVPAPETIRLGRQLAEGLATLHAAGLVHRDIKPNNVVFIGGEPRLADIDLVRPAEASLSLGGAQGYSPLEGPGRPAADVFSLGRTLYATVTGLPVGEFPRLPEDWDQRPDAADLQRLNAVLLRACDPDPARRHQTGAELAEDFRRLEQGEDVARSRQQRSRTRRLALAVAGLVAALEVALLVIVPAYRQRRDQAEFESYRVQINRAAQDITHAATEAGQHERNIIINADITGVEAEMIRRQADDANMLKAATNTFPIVLERTENIRLQTDPVSQVIFSDDDLQILVRYSRHADIHAVSTGRRLSTVTNMVYAAGFVSSGKYVTGTRIDEHGVKRLSMWDSSNGRLQNASVSGAWIPAGVLEDDATVIAISAAQSDRLVLHWNTRDGSTMRYKVTEYNLGSLFLANDVDASGQQHFIPYAVAARSGKSLYFAEVRPQRDIRYGKNGFEESQGSLLPLAVILKYEREGSSGEYNGNVAGFPPARPDGRPCISLSRDGNWSAISNTRNDGINVTRIDRHFTYQVTSMPSKVSAISRHGEMVATTFGEREVRLLHATHGYALQCVSIDAPVSAVVFNNSGTAIACGDISGRVRVWASPAYTPNLQRYKSSPPSAVSHLVVSEDETLIAATTGQHECAIFDAVTLARGTFVPQDSGPQAEEFMECGIVPLIVRGRASVVIGVSGDGKLTIESSKPEVLWRRRELWKRDVWKEKGAIIPWRLTPLFETNAFTHTVSSPSGCASQDGRRLILYDSKRVSVWTVDRASFNRITEADHPNGAQFTEAVLSSDSRWAVVLADDGSALLADLDTGATRLLRQLNERAVTACFRPNSTQCYFGTAGGQLLRLDTATDDTPELLDANFGLPAHMIATPDGERLLSAGPGEQLGIRRLPDGAPIVQLTHHGLALEPGRHNLKRLLYLPKQQRVISLSEDGWLTQW